ncbi:MAG: hypothetical protein LBU32_31765 [Clostridiales bacterium]|jgi:hypothetical protein|nr:hypothetical protein [Clostridiales bacterium]
MASIRKKQPDADSKNEAVEMLRPVVIEYATTTRSFAESLANEKFESLSLRSYSHGDTFALIKMAEKLEIEECLDDIIFLGHPGESGIKSSTSLLLLAVQTVCCPGDLDSFRGWFRSTSLPGEMNLDPEIFTKQYFLEQMELVTEDDLVEAEEELVDITDFTHNDGDPEMDKFTLSCLYSSLSNEIMSRIEEFNFNLNYFFDLFKEDEDAEEKDDLSVVFGDAFSLSDDFKAFPSFSFENDENDDECKNEDKEPHNVFDIGDFFLDDLLFSDSSHGIGKNDIDALSEFSIDDEDEYDEDYDEDEGYEEENDCEFGLHGIFSEDGDEDEEEGYRDSQAQFNAASLGFAFNDPKTKVQIFCCMLGQMLVHALHKELLSHGVSLTKLQMLENLKGIRRCCLKDKRNGLVTSALEEMDPLQSDIWRVIQTI